MAAIALAFAGCAGGGTPEGLPTPTITETVTPMPTAVKMAPPSPSAVTWPLTGLPGEVVERPALNVKIENSPEARPQMGIEDADIVWEEIVEGGISRYIVVWNSVIPAEIGPIRSIRPMDGNIAGPTHGLMVCSGGKGPFLKSARDAGLQLLSMDGGNAGFYRVNTRPAPHNVYADPADLLAQADEEHTAPPAPQFTYAPNPATASAATTGAVAPSIRLDMSGGAHPTWTWDEAEGVWQRSERDTPAEAASGARLTAVNVVAMEVEVRTAQGRDPAGNTIPESIVIGEGAGFVATGGKFLEITWAKDATTSVPTLTDASGQPVTLAPGNTWVELVPSSGSWTAETGADAEPSSSGSVAASSAPAPSRSGD
jgi:hypothetical protein